MKKVIKLFSILLILVVGIYFTDTSIKTMREKDPIMKEIKNSKDKYNINPVNAEIENNTIVPGIYGKEINYNETYNSMRDYGIYNESLTKLIDKKPTISIEDNYDKYITKGNSKNKKISIIIKLTKDNNLDNLLNIINDTKITFFIDGTLLENNLNNIRKLKDYEIEILSYDNKIEEVFFKTSISYLNQITKSKAKYCYTENENADLLKMCSKEKMHTIKINKVIRSYLYKEIKNNLENGMIYSLDTNNYNELKMSIDYIKSRGYEIEYLDCLLSEKVC